MLLTSSPAHRRSLRSSHAVLLIAAWLAGCGKSDPLAKPAPHPGATAVGGDQVQAKRADAAEFATWTDAKLETEFGPQVESFCTTCHALPRPDEAPLEEWRHEVEQAYAFHKKSPRKDQPAPEIEGVVAYFERKALSESDFVVPLRGDPDPGRLSFRKREIRLGGDRRSPAIANLTWIAPVQNRPGMLLACDMRSGGLFSISPNGEPEMLVAPSSRALANPCSIALCDLDGDAAMDLIVADLGSFYPADHQFGRVVWLKRKSEDGYEPIELTSGLGRVADVQPADFDGDGDQDLIVAEFGLYDTGRILLLENQGLRGSRLSFARCEVDPRHGAIHAPVADLNGDGKPDFVALIGQEHEVVEAFLNRGDGNFDQQRIYAAPNPSWGSSGIQLVDLDADGDLDVLCSNGDSFDRGYLKPYHALRWLENQGRFPWVDHHLMDMPGCQRALAGDLDRDGDLDIVAVALLPRSVLDRFGAERFDSVCWLEQTTPGEFQRRTLEASTCDHAALVLGDFDADGDLDLAVGSFDMREIDETPVPPVTLWWNETPLQARAAPARKPPRSPAPPRSAGD